MKEQQKPGTRFVGVADPKTTLKLLWGAASAEGETRPGRRPRLSVQRVAAEALALADEGGLPALSMRALGARLGVAAMALYRYVPNKDVLLELALEEAYAGLPEELPAGKGWQACLRQVATDAWSLYVAHPWMLQVSVQRPALGPHALRKYERELRAVERSGFSDMDMDMVVCVVEDFVRGSARSAVEASSAQATTGMTNAEWWGAHHAVLAGLVPAAQYPLARRIGTAVAAAYGGPTDPRRSFVFGLDRLLQGIEGHQVQPRRAR